MISNGKFSFEWMRKYQRGMMTVSAAGHAVSLALAIYAAYLSKWVLDILGSEREMIAIMLIIAGVCISPVLLHLMSALSDIMWNLFSCRGAKKLEGHIFDKTCDADYEKMEDPDQKTIYDEFWGYCYEPGEMIRLTIGFAFDIIKVAVFGTLLASLHPLIFVGLVVLAILQYLIRKPLVKFQEKMHLPQVANDRKFRYATWISRDYRNAKEVRIYGMSEWMADVGNDCLRVHRKIQGDIQNLTIALGLGTHFLNALRDGFAYVFLILKFADGELTPGDFMLYFSAITSVSSTLNGFANTLSEINARSLKVDELRRVEQFAITKRNHGAGAPIPTSAPEIEFRGVSYRYPKAEKDTIKNVSFKIKAGEKIALVGVNGAGKTTLIKLLCGFYIPTEGEILINGVPVDEYNIDDYFSIFSAVFQEVFLVPYTIAEHIAVTMDDTKIDRERVIDAIERAGLKEKVDSLEKGIDTYLIKDANEGGIDMSGGEKQKLALARAIYLARPVLVLDEPTSALDPIAENDMYRRFDENTGDKTAIFISHRLASTRFCDRIFNFNDGMITEEGTHEELMAAGGEYKTMFDVQASYYSDSDGEASE